MKTKFFMMLHCKNVTVKPVSILSFHGMHNVS